MESFLEEAQQMLRLLEEAKAKDEEARRQHEKSVQEAVQWVVSTCTSEVKLAPIAWQSIVERVPDIAERIAKSKQPDSANMANQSLSSSKVVLSLDTCVERPMFADMYWANEAYAHSWEGPPEPLSQAWKGDDTYMMGCLPARDFNACYLNSSYEGCCAVDSPTALTEGSLSEFELSNSQTSKSDLEQSCLQMLMGEPVEEQKPQVDLVQQKLLETLMADDTGSPEDGSANDKQQDTLLEALLAEGRESPETCCADQYQQDMRLQFEDAEKSSKDEAPSVFQLRDQQILSTESRSWSMI